MKIEEIAIEEAKKMGIQILLTNVNGRREFIPYCNFYNKGCFQSYSQRIKCPNYMEFEINDR